MDDVMVLGLLPEGWKAQHDSGLAATRNDRTFEARMSFMVMIKDCNAVSGQWLVETTSMFTYLAMIRIFLQSSFFIQSPKNVWGQTKTMFTFPPPSTCIHPFFKRTLSLPAKSTSTARQATRGRKPPTTVNIGIGQLLGGSYSIIPAGNKR